MKVLLSIVGATVTAVAPISVITNHNNNHQLRVAPTPQFNDKAFVYSLNNGYDYYAYYNNQAFKNPYGTYNDFGYEAKISTGNGQAQNLKKIQQWWIANKRKVNYLAEAMLSYFIYPVSVSKSLLTPYSGQWTYSKHFFENSAVIEQILFFKAFDNSLTLNDEAVNLMLNAVNHNQNLEFRFYSAFTNSLNTGMYGWIYIENLATHDSVTSNAIYKGQPI